MRNLIGKLEEATNLDELRRSDLSGGAGGPAAGGHVLPKDMVGPLTPAAAKLAAAIDDALEEAEDAVMEVALEQTPGGIDNPRSEAVIDLAWKVLWRQVGKQINGPGADPVRRALARL